MIAPLVVQAAQLEAFGGSGGVFMQNVGDLRIGGISSSFLGLTGLSATNADIHILAQGTLTIVEAVQTTGSGAVRLTAEGDLDLQARIDTEAGAQTLAAGGNCAGPGGDNLGNHQRRYSFTSR